jgi:hypothetical protein
LSTRFRHALLGKLPLFLFKYRSSSETRSALAFYPGNPQSAAMFIEGTFLPQFRVRSVLAFAQSIIVV